MINTEYNDKYFIRILQIIQLYLKSRSFNDSFKNKFNYKLLGHVWGSIRVTHGRAKAGRPARTYIQQLCEDTGCCPEDLPRAMNDW